jgi:predicted AlkP superfamily pyrophosphatase or phosphodiesterase
MFSVVLLQAVAGLAADVNHVLVIGVDGLGPVGIETAATPHIDRLMAQGAHTFKARAVMPTSSSPNWASMIMGAGPEQHGILGNEWPLPMAFIKPVAEGYGRYFPSMFFLLREAEPEAKIAVIYDWDGFFRLYESKLVDININGDGEDDTARQAEKVLRDEKPRLTFVHLDHVDHALHSEGYATEPYFRAVEKADTLIGGLMQALDDAGMAASTLVIVASDHGGKGKNHGGTSEAEMTIPWIVAGPGVNAGKTIGATVNIFDTAATVLHVLGVAPHQAWIGRPVLDAFEPAS